jgi:hypothetical protein
MRFHSMQLRIESACRPTHFDCCATVAMSLTTRALGRLVHQSNHELIVFQIKLRVLGGKGGFGALLRSKKATVKTTNFGACRDLNGRRLRHVDQERALQEWQATAAQREQEKKRSALEAADNNASTAATGRFTDTEFASETIQYCDSVAEAVRSKRKKEKTDDDEEDEDDHDDDEEDVDDEKKSSSKSSLKSTSISASHVAKKIEKTF